MGLHSLRLSPQAYIPIKDYSLQKYTKDYS
jgi:hypothetical protein